MPRRDPHAPERKVLAILLKDLRKRAGVSQYEAADLYGYSQSRVSKIEGGVQMVDLIEFLRICKVLGVYPGKAFQELLGRLEDAGMKLSNASEEASTGESGRP